MTVVRLARREAPALQAQDHGRGAELMCRRHVAGDHKPRNLAKSVTFKCRRAGSVAIVQRERGLSDSELRLSGQLVKARVCYSHQNRAAAVGN